MEKAVEIFTLVTGVLYVVLEIRQRNFMWVVGLATSLAAMYMFFTQGLFASFGLNCYYFGVSFWGLYCWRRDARKLDVEARPEAADVGEDKEERPGGNARDDKAERQEDSSGRGDRIHLNRMGWRTAALCGAAFVAGFLLLRFVLGLLHDPMTGLDAAVAVLSAVATFMLARSYIYQWLVWIVADLMSTVLCAVSGMYWMTALYAVYTLSAVYGYFYWKRKGVYIDGR